MSINFFRIGIRELSHNIGQRGLLYVWSKKPTNKNYKLLPAPKACFLSLKTFMHVAVYTLELNCAEYSVACYQWASDQEW